MEQLKSIGTTKQEFHIEDRVMHKPKFSTLNKKARFIPQAIPKKAFNKAFPFVLASVRSEGQFNSIIYEETDSYRHNAGRRTVFMSKSDAEKLKLQSGSLVDVVSSAGRMDDVSVQVFNLPEGNLLAYYPEANALTEHKIDPRSKTPNFKSVAVRIEIK